jgi:IS30 family transposase
MKVLRKTGHNQTMIATILSTHKYTVSRELQGKRGLWGYHPKQAQVKALQRQHKKPQGFGVPWFSRKFH